MMPINDAGRKLIIQAIENEIEQLSIELSIPLEAVERVIDWDSLESPDRVAARRLYDAELNERLESYKHLQRGLVENQLLIMNVRPQCMAKEITSDPDRSGSQCQNEGNFAPCIVVYAKDGRTPIAQMDTTPPLRLCEKHANGNVGQFLPKDKWAEVQAAVMQQAGQLVTYDDARILYMDAKTGALVPPPAVSIARG